MIILTKHLFETFIKILVIII